jgi:hypothetical protein
LAFWAYVFMPDSQVLDFVDMMRIWKIGEDVDPTIANRYVSFLDPENGIRYYARRFGDEDIFGKTYDRGIAAKMLQCANSLAAQAYELDETTPVDPVTGAVNAKLDTNGRPLIADDGGITLESSDPRVCQDNIYCKRLRDYRGLIDFVRDLGHQVGFIEPELATIEN